MIRRMTIVLLTCLGCLVLGTVISGHWVGVSFGAGGGGDESWTYRLGPVDGWLRLTYLCGETYDLDDETLPQRHWWGEFTKAGPPGEEDYWLELPAWELLALFLFYPVTAIVRGVLVRPQRRTVAKKIVSPFVPAPQQRRFHRLGWLKDALLSIMLLLTVSATILSILSWWITAGLEIGGKANHGATVERQPFWFNAWLSDGWFDVSLIVGPATGNFGFGVEWYGGFVDLSSADYRYYVALFPVWEIIGLSSLYLAAVLLFSIARRVRRYRRRLRGLCVQCGYDLTGNVSGACPECWRAADTDSY